MRAPYRGHVDEKLPEGLLASPSAQIPEGVVHGARRKMNDTLLGTNPTAPGMGLREDRSRRMDGPSKLWVCDEVIPCFSQIGKQRLDLFVHQTIGDRLDRLTNLWESSSSSSHRFGSFVSLSLSLAASLQSNRAPDRKRRLTMSFPRPIVNVMPCPTRSEFVYSEMYAEE